jgi:uncharacterized RDD family membrane protein YckC
MDEPKPPVENISASQNGTISQPPSESKPPTEVASQPQTKEVAETPKPQYGGVSKRSVAATIDGVLVSIATGLVGLVFFLVNGLSGMTFEDIQAGAASSDSRLVLYTIQMAINGLINIVYYVGFLAYRGATPGKMAMGLTVVTTQMKKPNLATAVKREIIGKFVSVIVFGLGYLSILWDAKKQGWHDKIAGTYVIMKDSIPSDHQV